MDVRLKTEPFALNGKVYNICCNMNVLADVQEAYGGDFRNALNNPTSLRTSLVFLAAMLNDAADTNGWPERFTAKDLGRMLPVSASSIQKITDVVRLLVTSSFYSESLEEAAEEKN